MVHVTSRIGLDEEEAALGGQVSRAFPRGTWVAHSHGPGWHAMELGAVRRLANGSTGGTSWSVPAGLPGIFLGRLRRGRRGGGLCELVTVLWMGRELLCRMEDLVRYEPNTTE